MDTDSKIQAEMVFTGFGNRTIPSSYSHVMRPATDEHLLIQPKKLVNPVLESKNHVTMQNELKLNKKLGINVLNQKSELTRVFQEKQREQNQQENIPKKSEFELMLEKRRKENEKNEEREIAELAVPEFVKKKEQLRKSWTPEDED